MRSVTDPKTDIVRLSPIAKLDLVAGVAHQLGLDQRCLSETQAIAPHDPRLPTVAPYQDHGAYLARSSRGTNDESESIVSVRVPTQQKALVKDEGFCFQANPARSDSVVANALVVAVPPVGTACG